MYKTELRKKFSAIRKENYSAEKCGLITQNILNTVEYNSCKSVFVYISYNNEADTYGIIKQALRDKKRVAVPYVTDKAHTMVFIEIEGFDGLIKNKYGIEEPVYNNEKVVVPDESSIIIVPGLAFDRNSYRLGYGGGYYDKYLSENKSMCNIGIGFQCQITDRLITEATDVKLDKVITEV